MRNDSPSFQIIIKEDGNISVFVLYPFERKEKSNRVVFASILRPSFHSSISRPFLRFNVTRLPPREMLLRFNKLVAISFRYLFFNHYRSKL